MPTKPTLLLALSTLQLQEELGLSPVEESRAWMQYLVPKDREEKLRPFLAALEARRQELGVTDVQISLTSLEEVFLNIARKVRCGLWVGAR